MIVFVTVVTSVHAPAAVGVPRKLSLPTTTTYDATGGPYRSIEVTRYPGGPNEASWSRDAFRWSVHIQMTHERGEFDFGAQGAPHVGLYPISSDDSDGPDVRTDLDGGSLGPRHYGFVRIHEIRFGDTSNDLTLAATLTLRSAATSPSSTPITAPFYAAVGVNTTWVPSLPGEPALHRLGDFNGDGVSDIAVFRPSTAQWFVRGHRAVTYGRRGDQPVPGDYNGDGASDIAVFRPSSGRWFVRGSGTVGYGRRGDVPAPAAYADDGTTDLAVFRPSDGTFRIRGIAALKLGRTGDVPVPAFFLGGSHAYGYGSAPALFRPTDGRWRIVDETHEPARQFGHRGDIPIPGQWWAKAIAGGPQFYDYPAVFRPRTGAWYLHQYSDSVTVTYGRSGDQPV